MNGLKKAMILSSFVVVIALVVFNLREYRTAGQVSNSNTISTNSERPIGNSKGGANRSVVETSVGPSCDVDLAPSPKQTAASFQIRILNNNVVKTDENTRRSLNDWFSVFAGANLKPFTEGKAKETGFISFALARLFAYKGYGLTPNEPQDKDVSCQNALRKLKANENDCSGVVSSKGVDRLTEKYFGASVKHSTISNDQFSLANGCYFHRIGCADGEMTFDFAIIKSIEPLRGGVFVAKVTNYSGWSSLYAECNSDCDKKRLQNIKDASEVADFETIMKLCPQWEATAINDIRAKFRITSSSGFIRPVLLSYELAKTP